MCRHCSKYLTFSGLFNPQVLFLIQSIANLDSERLGHLSKVSPELVKLDFTSRYCDARSCAQSHCVTKACWVNPHIQKVLPCRGSEHTRALQPDSVGSNPDFSTQWLWEVEPTTSPLSLCFPACKGGNKYLPPRAFVRTNWVNADHRFTIAPGTHYTSTKMYMLLSTLFYVMYQEYWW